MEALKAALRAIDNHNAHKPDCHIYDDGFDLEAARALTRAGGKGEGRCDECGHPRTNHSLHCTQQAEERKPSSSAVIVGAISLYGSSRGEDYFTAGKHWEDVPPLNKQHFLRMAERCLTDIFKAGDDVRAAALTAPSDEGKAEPDLLRTAKLLLQDAKDNRESEDFPDWLRDAEKIISAADRYDVEVQPFAFITKKALACWQQGADPEWHVLLRGPSEFRVPLYLGTPPAHPAPAVDRPPRSQRRREVMDHKAFQKVLAPIDFGEHSQEYGLQMYEHGKRQGYREAIEAAARVAREFDGPGHPNTFDAIAQSIRALLPQDAVSEGER